MYSLFAFWIGGAGNSGAIPVTNDTHDGIPRHLTKGYLKHLKEKEAALLARETEKQQQLLLLRQQIESAAYPATIIEDSAIDIKAPKPIETRAVDSGAQELLARIALFERELFLIQEQYQLLQVMAKKKRNDDALAIILLTLH